MSAGATSSEESWSSVLKRARNARCDGSDDDFYQHFQDSCLANWEAQINKYNDYLSLPRDPDQQLRDDEKSLILETRSALRFGLCCLSCENEIERRDLQTRVASKDHQWHAPLTTLLSQESGDSKCRVYASKLFSNIVTSNDVTATVVSSEIRLSPSADDISRTMQTSLSPHADNQEHLLEKSDWASMMIAASRRGDRESLAGVVAALYNCTVALRGENQLSLARQISSNTILISTLMRQFVSVQSIKASIDTKEDNYGDDWDSATDWIFLLVVRLFGFGMLPVMYKAIPGGESLSVLPEQNVLLHCAAQEAQYFIDNGSQNPEGTNPFSARNVGWETLKTSYEFLADLFCRQYQGGRREGDETDSQLARSAALSSLDVISITLGIDNADCAKLREHLGSNTGLLKASSLLLGSMVDELTERSVGRKARDLTLSPEEQQWMVSLVRLMGNICYNCRSNQDRLRFTLVPPLSKTAAPSTSTDVARNAVHVLLSCTSFATSCFTLREWGVIAIRNILQDNQENQQVVAALDAQDAVQTAALDQAGVRVQMDKMSGKVSLTPLDENKAS